MINAIFLIILAFTMVIGFVFMPTPIGNENSTVRRLPWVTFSIIIVNLFIFVVTLPAVSRETREYDEAATDLSAFLGDHSEFLRDPKSLDKLVDAGLISQQEADKAKKGYGSVPSFGEAQSKPDSSDNEPTLESLFGLSPDLRQEAETEFNAKVVRLKEARDAHIWFRFGLAPNGKWKWYQPLTSAFIHEGWMHVLGNMLFLFAVAFSLEDLWGRSVFLVFYLVAAVAACLPELISPIAGPSFGASGAVSAVMGAFLIRLYKTKIKIFWLSIPYMFMLLLHRVKPYGVVNIAAYIYLPFFFITQALNWWLVSGTERPNGIAYSVHVAGFAFGALFAFGLKLAKVEERFLNPKIESKVSFSGSTEVSDAMEMIDRGELGNAEAKLRLVLSHNPNDIDALMGLIQVHQRTGDYQHLNSLYSRVIRHHLSHGDKEAALYAYDALLCAAPEGEEIVQIPPRDWFTICEFLRSSGMNQEASVEFERLANSCSDTAVAARACLQGGEAALAIKDYNQALKLFRLGASMNAGGPLGSKVESSLAGLEERISKMPAWEQPKDFVPTPGI